MGNRFRVLVWRVQSVLPASAAALALLLPLIAAAAAAIRTDDTDPDQLRREIVLIEVENQALMAQAERINRRQKAIEEASGVQSLTAPGALALLIEERCGLSRDAYELSKDDVSAEVQIKLRSPPLSGLCIIDGLRLSGLRGAVERLEITEEYADLTWRGSNIN